MQPIQTAMITGANAGIGRETARQLAKQPGIEKIYLACRSREKAQETKAALEAETGRAIFEIIVIDVANLASVAAAVETLSSPIDAVVLNAGGMGGKTPNVLTDAGVTNVFAMNLLGHAVLVEKLLEKQLITSTVLLAGTEAARGIPKLGVAAPEMDDYSVEEFAGIADGSKFGRDTNAMSVYATIKLTGAMWMGAMARQHPHIRFITMSPGSTTGTNGLDHMPFVTRILSKYVFGTMAPLFGLMHRVEDGAKRFVDGLLNPRYESGHFYGSEAGAPTGPVTDQAKLDASFSNTTYQDNAYAALRQFA